ncbi:thiol-disulfide oxidoreductase DCC family protein [Streptomyces sp. NPDC013181]|uniref:thiol-disulfide oxidoreductase DCC family protein n=1 Tax=Streptomyces sp. NPDC013181 TaxID=3364864 RepID=UPI0036AB7FB1
MTPGIPPTPVTQPPVLIYDGDCGFCTRAVLWLSEHAVPGVPVLPYQGEDLAAWGLSERRCTHEVVHVDAAGRLRGGVQGFAALLRGSPHRGWRAAGSLLPLPPLRWAALGVYRLIARNRHRMPGGTAACAVRRV